MALQEGGKYGDLFGYALRNFGVLCIGLYRFRDTTSTPQKPSSKRYVITNPPDDFILLPTDKVSMNPTSFILITNASPPPLAPATHSTDYDVLTVRVPRLFLNILFVWFAHYFIVDVVMAIRKLFVLQLSRLLS